MPDSALSLSSAAIGYDRKLVFEDLSLDIPPGQVTALCGPNGCGKSTALKAMRRVLPLSRGEASLLDRPLSEWPARELARELAMLSQTPEAPGEMSVEELVALGRYAHRPPLSGRRATDRAAVTAAMSAVDVSDLAARPIGALSGGQLQRVWLAMVIAQESPVVLLDEPTNHLDIAHALETLSLVRHLSRAMGKTVVVVLHDLNLAARFADRLVFFRAGQIVSQGAVGEVFREEIISEVFGIDCEVRAEGPEGRPFFLPHHRAVRQAAE
ncbi:ABC transporter ATP-binding protein [Tranquillimonas alkanivorans]|uniref:Iron complex transport system ATP-binding protein n=1 Tax=Tranquillimonas alkanivorans TaxID=441119 RepID=A0A1I5WTL5_9RHOB|nr:ABC transporter ATP-binding protein [Tranquillimonas alkanivorans]SFQ22981.1 iron complex transport system ATP-binding protein [Tranquillimonas alkanivorans]